MRNYIEETHRNVRLQEGVRVIEQMLIQCYMRPGISTKDLARDVLLPVPVSTAIKKELIKAGILQQESGVQCTKLGKEYIENRVGYGGLDKALYQKLMINDTGWRIELKDILSTMEGLFTLRPQVNVQIDQSKCTAETSLRRAILCLRDYSLIGKKILCVGDDDLVSVSLALLLMRLFPTERKLPVTIDVIDIDERFLRYIKEIAVQKKLPIRVHQVDLRYALPEQLHAQYDCFFTDPPYTLQGMSLFLSRGVTALQKQKGLSVFLSFAHKSPDFMLSMHREFVEMGLMVREIISNFNEYEGAQMIGNRGQMIVLTTTEHTTPKISNSFKDPFYTGEIKRTLRTYRCKKCNESILVGIEGRFTTIEELKNQRCPRCRNNKFELVLKSRK
ncbi:bis-aminopropyl spermidine synthase family protein [Brevibacillus daliensis]|uniref:bis-aminopropyl spermidine synthase family protein n=1 Tax=Brevibacillus daliensis TaxID=2892995 RepID=UPI001E4CDB50|nr:bis-aminopropyl spermidine synthase family protein [Brevibacillus daliensis]